MLKCYRCQTSVELGMEKKIQRHDDCPSCKADLRCCRMCKFYDPNAYNQCQEPIAERIVEKEKANFCDFFVVGNPGASDDNKNLLDAAMALFKK